MTSASSNHFNLEQVLKTCEVLSIPQKKYVLKALNLTDICSPGDALGIWVADLCTALSFISSEQVWFILEHFKDKIKVFGDSLYLSLNSKSKDIPVIYLGIGDRDFAALTGYPSILNLKTCNVLDAVGVEFFETIQYNLTKLYLRKKQKLGN